jgi:hypothetical protein
VHRRHIQPWSGDLLLWLGAIRWPLYAGQSDVGDDDFGNLEFRSSRRLRLDGGVGGIVNQQIVNYQIVNQ